MARRNSPLDAHVLPMLSRLLIAASLVVGCDGVAIVVDEGARTITADPGSAKEAAEPATLPTPHRPGHAKMLELLSDIAARTDEESFFLGDRLARELRAALQGLPAGAKARTRWKIRHQLGVVEMRLGRVRAAIEHLGEARRLIAEANLGGSWSARTRFDLAMAFFRLGEVENCCRLNTPESCLLPISEEGRHTNREGSQRAIGCLLEVLEATSPKEGIHRTAVWLLNIAHMTLGSHPDGVPGKYRIAPAAFRSRRSFPRFVNVAKELGLSTVNLSGGAVVDDLDGDGHLDILTSTWDTRGGMRFFHNDADGSFSDRTAESGLRGLLGGLNMKHADYDNDGDLDVLVLRGGWLGAAGRHPNSLLRNDGGARFTDVTLEAGLAEVHYPTQTAGWADYDNDGDVDLYVGNESSNRVRSPSQLFRNNGDGTFTDVAAAAGVENHRYAKGVVWGDHDGDRFADLYVSNLRGANRLYHNNGDGTFTDVAVRLGVDQPFVSFPVWFWDFDNDGALDLWVSSYEGRVDQVAAYYLGEPVEKGLPRLYRGDGRGGFTDVTRAQGLDHPVLPMGSNFGDVDGDGYPDFYLGTGDPDFHSLTPNLMFVNRGGRGFDNVTFAGGFGHLQKGHSVAFADIDNDGDLDVFQQMGGAYAGDAFGDALYENPGFARHWIAVKLVGTDSNRAAIGARLCVRVRSGSRSRSIYRHVTSGGSFGAGPLRQTVGLGNADAIESLEVSWPCTGKTQTLTDVPLDRTLRIVEGKPGVEVIALEAFRLGRRPDPRDRTARDRERRP